MGSTGSRTAPNARAPGALLTASFEAWNARDLDKLASMFAEDVEYDSTEIGDAVIHGRSKLRAYFDQVLAVTEFDFEVESVLEAGERVAVVLALRGRGEQSGAPFLGRLAQLSVVRDGLICAARWYTDPQEALAAIALTDRR